MFNIIHREVHTVKQVFSKHFMAILLVSRHAHKVSILCTIQHSGESSHYYIINLACLNFYFRIQFADLNHFQQLFHGITKKIHDKLQDLKTNTGIPTTNTLHSMYKVYISYSGDL